MKFVKKEIIMDFGPPQYILSNNGLKFDCKAVQDFADLFNIQWKCTSTYNPQGNRIAERMVGTPKKSLQKVTQIESKEWVQSLEYALYRYRRIPGMDGIAPFEILFGVKPRFSIQPSVRTSGAEVLSHARSFELAMALLNFAEPLVPRSVHGDIRYQIGDMVLLRRGRLSEGSKFQAHMWLGPYKVTSAHQPVYVLENAPERKSRKTAHFRSLRQYQVRVGLHREEESSC